MEPLKTLTISESRWLRGIGDEDSYLKSPTEDKLCCLGFCALAAGYPINEITSIRQPADLDPPQKIIEAFPFLLKERMHFGNYKAWIDSDVTNSLMEINDDETISDDERKEKLTQVFADNGVTVTWEP